MALEPVAIDTKIGPVARQLKPSVGKEVLIHDGKQIIARHGPEATTGCGNPAYTMITGTKAEIDAEVARLKLKTLDDSKIVEAPIEVIR